MMRALVALASLAAAGAAAAPVATPALSGYSHTAWTALDGAPAQISTMAQTTDGWLWLGSADGLYRFDGVVFERYTLPERGMLGRSLIYTLQAGRNGDLWISHRSGGMSVLHADGRLEDIPERIGQPVGPVSAFDVDAGGAIWVISTSGMYVFADRAWHTIADGATWYADETRSLMRGQDGTLWASYDRKIWRYDAASGRMVPGGPAGASGAMMQAPDGSVWAGRGAAVVQVAPGAGGARVVDRNQAESRWSGQFDRDGNLWKTRCPANPCMLPAAVQHGAELDPTRMGRPIVAPGQISGNAAEQVLEDREGNIWIATENGLDRYQAQRLHPSGLNSAGASMSIAADADGGVWAADAASGALWRLEAGRAPQLQGGRYARVVGSARDGALLLAGKRSIERRLHGVVTQIALPPGPAGTPADLTVVGTLDDGKVLWMASYETGLMGYVDGQWKPRSAFNLPAKIVISSAGAPGQLWLADGDGGLTLYDDGKLTRYDAAMAGVASAVFAGSEVMVAGERGLAVLQHGAMRLLRTHRTDAGAQDLLRNISGLAITPDGDRWFNGAAGIIHVRAADWQRAMARPQELLVVQLLDARDGYPGQAAAMNRLPSVVQAAGGQLWFNATGGVVRLETRTLQRNLVGPQVQIQRVSTAQANYRAGAIGNAPVQLPPASNNFSIAWTAPALRRPENLRYAYWLEGVDSTWRDGAGDRVASYTNVGPGHYRFHVRVANEDGVPGAREAVQAIAVAPTMLQSAWFRAFCVLGAVLLGVAAYRYRIRVLTARLSERLQVRASERERIARTLHDTYLQTVNALMLRVDAMAQSLPPGHPTRATLETVLADASDAVIEGRGQVEQLRASPGALADSAPDALEHSVARIAAPLRQCYPNVGWALQVTGAPRQLAQAVLDEAGQVAFEALRNAFLHAQAGRIGVTIDYATPFSVTVDDNGKGLDDDVRRLGYRSGHWGLLGMRERARAIGAALTVDSAPGSGTTVRLTVPDAYAGSRPGWRTLLPARWFGGAPLEKT
jgi:signal transduction histidine kinase